MAFPPTGKSSPKYLKKAGKKELLVGIGKNGERKNKEKVLKDDAFVFQMVCPHYTFLRCEDKPPTEASPPNHTFSKSNSLHSPDFRTPTRDRDENYTL